MRKNYYLIFLLTLVPILSVAQPWHAVTKLSGVENTGGIQVTITPNNSPGAGGLFCGNNYPYRIGNDGLSNSYRYSFSSAVNKVRFQLNDVSNGELIKIMVNGTTSYVVKPADITSYTPSCSPTLKPTANGNGEITNIASSNSDGQVIVQLTSGVISNITIQHLNGVNTGTFYNVSFSLDTPVTFKHPFIDTMLCAGSSFQLNYIVNSSFTGSNKFMAEMSDAAGNFSNPLAIGNVTSNATGAINCTIPANTPSGTGYRLRIKSSSPPYTVYGPAPIQIDRFALPPYATIKGKDSFCEGEILYLETKYHTPGMTINWTGPAGFNDTAVNPVKEDLQVEDSGEFYFVAALGGCRAYDTVAIRVYINPPIQDIFNNGPMCEEDTLRITLIDSVGLPITYAWAGPNGFSDTVKNPVIENVSDAYTGTFTVWSKLGFCYSTTSTNVLINTRPDIPTITNNGPLFPGKELKLNGTSPTPGVDYQWTGPDNFSSTLPDPTIPFVPVEAAGVYRLTVSLGNCSRSAITVVDIQNPTRAIVDLYPNVIKGNSFKLEGIANQEQKLSYVIVDIYGHILHEGSVNTKRRLIDDTVTLPTELPNGLYYFKMKVDGDFKTFPITIMR